MIEKVTLQLTPDGTNMLPVDNKPCQDFNPKALMLYSFAKCAGLTTMMIFKQSHVTVKHFEISVSGELSTPTLQAESEYRSFHIVYNVECGTEADQVKVSHAIVLAHDKYCGLAHMYAKIAPVTREIAIVSTKA